MECGCESLFRCSESGIGLSGRFKRLAGGVLREVKPQHKAHEGRADCARSHPGVLFCGPERHCHDQYRYQTGKQMEGGSFRGPVRQGGPLLDPGPQQAVGKEGGGRKWDAPSQVEKLSRVDHGRRGRVKVKRLTNRIGE